MNNEKQNVYEKKAMSGNEGIVLGTISVEVNTAVHHIKILRWIYMEYMIKSYQILSSVVLSLAKLFTCLYLFWGQKCEKSAEITRILAKCIDFFLSQ